MILRKGVFVQQIRPDEGLTEIDLKGHVMRDDMMSGRRQEEIDRYAKLDNNSRHSGCLGGVLRRLYAVLTLKTITGSMFQEKFPGRLDRPGLVFQGAGAVTQPFFRAGCAATREGRLLPGPAPDICQIPWYGDFTSLSRRAPSPSRTRRSPTESRTFLQWRSGYFRTRAKARGRSLSSSRLRPCSRRHTSTAQRILRIVR